MSNSDCATVIKRGYLFDKKAGILDPKKKWFVLREDPLMGYCILEFFKDERSWTRREPPKGFINVRDIVEVLKVPDKKQTLEFLCPGVGYRLMANSEADADDWVDAVKKLIVYRKDNRSMSFPLALTPGESSSLSRSPPNIPFNSSMVSRSFPNNTLTIPSSTCIDGSHLLQQSNQQRIPYLFPTPPETSVDTPTQFNTSTLQKQQSNDGIIPYPSPPSSSDSASMCGSYTSFDSGSLHDIIDAENFHKVCNRFRVSINDTDKFNIQGECDLIINENGLTLINLTNGSQVANWPLGSVRRYGVNSVCFTFESGRYCSTGEGQYFLYSHQSRLIYNKIHFAISRINQKDTKKISTAVDTATMISMPGSKVSLLSDSFSSSPQYNHIEHNIKQLSSHEQYSKLQQTSPSAFTSNSSFGALPNYEKLNHPTGVTTIFGTKHTPCDASSLHYPLSNDNIEPVYSSLNETDNEIMFENDNSLTTIPCDNPPPIPPRLAKVTSI